MPPQVPESAQLAYSFDNLTVFEPSRAPLEPSGCEPDHFKALKPDQNGRRGGQIALLDGKKRNRTAPNAILPVYERHRVVRFAPRGAQGRPGGPQKLQIPSVICYFGRFTDFKGHFGPLASIWAPLCENCAVANTKCMFLPLKAQNPAILPRRPIRARAPTTVFYDDFGVDRPPGEDGRILHL